MYALKIVGALLKACSRDFLAEFMFWTLNLSFLTVVFYNSFSYFSRYKNFYFLLLINANE